MPSSSPLAPRHLPSASLHPKTRRRVAVLGAGASGLVSARELRREGQRVVILERGGSVGGTWVYTPAVESDPLSLDPGREVVQSSLYESLRTNIPRESMGFLDYPFVARHRRGNGNGKGDPRRFPGHPEVLRYLEDFARDFDLYGLVRFWTEVGQVEREKDGRWAVRSRRVRGGDGGDESEVYDAVVVCNGHYTEPRVADIPGIDAWPGKQIHSHNYRAPKPFIDQVVVIIGSSTSAHDISRDISGSAKEVHIASRSALVGTPNKLPGYGNVWLHSMVERANEDGHVVFQDGSSVHVDVIIHCTGYRYSFPFLKTNGIVNVDDNRVGPLYKHIFPPELAPCLSFIGIPQKVLPFPTFELQSKWVAGVLSGRIALPTQEEMMEDVKAFYLQMEVDGWPKRYTHNLSKFQFEYLDWLAHECGYPAVEEWRKQMFVENTKYRRDHPESFRDEWDDDHLVAEAHRDFQKFL
ncbi:flavin-containing monooxygenase FMO GS-OX-like 3 [Phoenix dactylifera]|uniref:Flavin-containing monooxygenase n=1 Tax=Phoenix dactylifera TaxID=42345 RepID=A0A8B8J3B4_PHODC|nr:flavin-containing monooxygenase FMO GS-OX-like 3 [Phoenix dactylifera]